MREGSFLKRREIEFCGIKEEKRIIEPKRLNGMGDGGSIEDGITRTITKARIIQTNS